MKRSLNIYISLHLQDRRRDARLCMMYKVDRRLVAIEKDMRLVSTKKKSTRHSHARAYQVPSCRTERRRMSPFPRTVWAWNALPQGLIEAESLDAFKALVFVLGFNDTSTLVGHFVSSPREREKSDRRDSRRDEREGQGRKEQE